MKRNILIIVCVTLLITGSYAQVAINETGATPDPSAILDLSSTDKGLLIPRVTTSQRSAIGTTQTGLLVYDTTTESFWYYDNTQATWVEMVVDGVMGIDGLSDANSDGTSVYLGSGAGTVDDGANYNTSIGTNSLPLNTSGSHNTSVGSDNMYKNTIGSRNTAIGRRANYYNQEGTNNTIIGYSAGMGTSNHNKSGNIFLGYLAGYLETGDNKLYIENSSSSTPLIGGDFSTNEIYFNGSVKITGGSPGLGKILTSDTDGVASWEDNAAAGEINDLSDGKTDANSLFLGEASGATDDGSNYNTGVGFNSLNATTSGQYNISLGYKSMLLNTSGSNNVGLGYFALPSNTTGTKNTGVGSKSLYWNTSGYNNIAVGYNSLNRNSTGISNVAIGTEALYNNTSKSNLVAVGDSVLFNNGNSNPTSTQATLNTGVGSKAMLNNTTGYNNTAMGSSSLYSNTTGFHNVGIGYASLEDNDGGDYNTAIGSYASAVNTSGSNNVNIGYAADYYNNGGSNNVVIGVHAGRGSSGQNKSGNIFVGYKAGYSESGNNKLYIHNSESTSPLIYGDFSTSSLGFNATVGIGTQTPIGNFQIHDPVNQNNIVYITPKNSTGDTSTIFFSENNTATLGMYWMYDGTGNQMELWGLAGGVPRGPHMLIDRNTGNMAIGGENFATGYKLSIEGKVICEEVRVSLLADWPDYVFGSDYNLPSLNELKIYIDKNGHLPNIPSADEVESSGIELGEMQRLMMEKIEELSLYIIQQQEQLDLLKSQINKVED